MSFPIDNKPEEASHVQPAATGTTSACLEHLEIATPSPLLLPTAINSGSLPPPDHNLHETDSQSSGENASSTTTLTNNAALLAQLHLSTASPWDRQCECGGISPHYHGRGFLHDMMNGTHPPTGPRGEQTTTTGTPTSPVTASPTQPKRPGRLPNHVQVAKTYVFEQEIQRCLKDNGVSLAREDNIRLAGVQWIDNVRRALKL